ncbi:MAG: hypothetical protein LBJ64_07485 [Deltaproteobacteria bacterium]|jgi:hypothetical protein|nr:hypothetical protein [Deltaproteobacteria bacterium]
MAALGLGLLLGSYSAHNLWAQRLQGHRGFLSSPPGPSESSNVKNKPDVQKGLPPASIQPIAEDEAKVERAPERQKSVVERFKDEIQKRLAKAKDLDTVGVSRKAEQLAAEASEIGAEMGQAKANEFMNKILAASNKNSLSSSLDLAVNSFFAELSEAAIVSPALYQKLENAHKMLADSGVPKTQDAEDSAKSAAPKNNSAQMKLYESYLAGRPDLASFRTSSPDSLGLLVNAAV